MHVLQYCVSPLHIAAYNNVASACSVLIGAGAKLQAFDEVSLYWYGLVRRQWYLTIVRSGWLGSLGSEQEMKACYTIFDGIYQEDATYDCLIFVWITVLLDH